MKKLITSATSIAADVTAPEKTSMQVFLVDGTLTENSSPQVTAIEVPMAAVVTNGTETEDKLLADIAKSLEDGEVHLIAEALSAEDAPKVEIDQNLRAFTTFGNARGWFVDNMVHKIKMMQGLTGKARDLRKDNVVEGDLDSVKPIS